VDLAALVIFLVRALVEVVFENIFEASGGRPSFMLGRLFLLQNNLIHGKLCLCIISNFLL